MVVAAVRTSHGSSAADASPVPTARAFRLPPVVAGAPPAALTAAPGHPVVLAFFASWCQPCAQELPLVEELSRSWDRARASSPRPDSVPATLGVDELDQRPDGEDLVRRAGVTFPAAFDHDGSVGREWALDGLPVTVFIAGSGRVVDYHRGQLGRRQLEALVRHLLSARG